MGRKAKVEILEKKPIEERLEALGKDSLTSLLGSSQLTDLIGMSLCAWAGYSIGSKNGGTNGPQDAAVGAVGYKLATTQGGTPPVSQVAGLAILAALGLTSLLAGGVGGAGVGEGRVPLGENRILPNLWNWLTQPQEETQPPATTPFAQPPKVIAPAPITNPIEAPISSSPIIGKRQVRF